MKTYKITRGNKQYVIKAKDTYSAVVKLQTFLKDSDPTVVGKLRISEYDGGPGKMWNHTLTIHKDEDGYYWSMKAGGEDLIDTERYPNLDKLKEGYEKERESYHKLNYVESWGDLPSSKKRK